MNKKIIAFQGALGANSHLACQTFYKQLEPRSFSTFYDVFQAVLNGDADYGIIPLENSYAGRVSEIHNLLQENNVSIVAEHFFAVNHYLAGIEDSKITDGKEVYSHPQALMQCQKNIRQLNLKPVEFSNTAEAGKFISLQKDNTKFAICSEEACKIYNLKILEKNFQDSNNENITIFIVISKQPAELEIGSRKIITSMIFTIRNIPGALYKALGGFATNGISMIKLESYIPGGSSIEAKFFIAIDGHPTEKKVALALEELGFFSKNVKLLGVYYADKSRS